MAGGINLPFCVESSKSGVADLTRWGGGVYIDPSETEDGKTPEEG